MLVSLFLKELLSITGIILYELLTVLNKEEWLQCIMDLRGGFVNHDNRLLFYGQNKCK